MTHQMASVAQFAGEIALVSMTHKWNGNRGTELNTIAGLLATDPTKHDKTMESPPVGLKPGHAVNSKFTNDILLVVNQGKAGNLTNAQMSTAINTMLSTFLAPINTVPPAVTGTGTVGQTLTCAPGTWQNSPTFTYAWQRAGVAIAGATATTYVLVAADSGKSISCKVTAKNAKGSDTVSSNSVAVA